MCPVLASVAPCVSKTHSRARPAGLRTPTAKEGPIDLFMGNLLMIVLTAAVLAIFDRPDVKAITPRLSGSYQLITGATVLHLTMVNWCPISAPVAGIVVAPNHMVIVNVIFMFGVALAAISLVHRNLLRKLGVYQVFGASVEPTLCTDGLYAVARYPFQFGVIVALWFGQPTYGRWFFAAGMTCALYCQTVLRDEDLARVYGDKFAAAAARVSRFGPLLSNPFSA